MSLGSIGRSVLAAAALLAAQTAHADDAPPPKAYIIAEIEVTNPAPYQEYVRKVTPVVEQYHGRYVARGARTVALEGTPPKGRVIVLEFPSFDAAQAFYQSPEYQAIVPIRYANSTARVFVVEGGAP